MNQIEKLAKEIGLEVLAERYKILKHENELMKKALREISIGKYDHEKFSGNMVRGLKFIARKTLREIEEEE